MANQLGLMFSRLDCTPRWRERPHQLAMPTLVVHGRRDRFFPVGNGEALARDIPLGAAARARTRRHRDPRDGCRRNRHGDACAIGRRRATRHDEHTLVPPDCRAISTINTVSRSARCSEILQRVRTPIGPARREGSRRSLDRDQKRCAGTCCRLQTGLARHRPDVSWLLGVRPDPVGCALLAGARLDRPSAYNACQGPEEHERSVVG
jgi:hypothetical protein